MEQFSFVLLKIGIPVLVTLGLAGNIISGLVFLQKNMFSSFTLLLTCLAVADSIFLTCRAWIFHNYYSTHKLVYFLSFIAQTCSGYLTVAISYERYQAVCHPLAFGCSTSVKRATRISLVVVIASILINIPEILYTAYDFTVPEPWFIAYLCFESAFKILIPLILLGLFNVPICRQIRKLSTDPLKGKNNNNGDGLQTKSSKDRVILVVVAVYAFCYIPFLIYTAEQLTAILTVPDTSEALNFTQPLESQTLDQKYSNPKNNDSSYFWIWLKFTTTLNSSVNFIIYFLVGSKFRKALITWTKSVIRRNRAGSSTSAVLGTGLKRNGTVSTIGFERATGGSISRNSKNLICLNGNSTNLLSMS